MIFMGKKENIQSKDTHHLRIITNTRKMPKRVLIPENYKGILHANADDVQKIVEHLESHRL
jgi:hypothetical protein